MKFQTICYYVISRSFRENAKNSNEFSNLNHTKLRTFFLREDDRTTHIRNIKLFWHLQFQAPPREHDRGPGDPGAPDVRLLLQHGDHGPPLPEEQVSRPILLLSTLQLTTRLFLAPPT